MFCTKCGNKLMDGALFCTKCGTRIAQPTETPVKKSSEDAEFHHAIPQNQSFNAKQPDNIAVDKIAEEQISAQENQPAFSMPHHMPPADDATVMLNDTDATVLLNDDDRTEMIMPGQAPYIPPYTAPESVQRESAPQWNQDMPGQVAVKPEKVKKEKPQKQKKAKETKKKKSGSKNGGLLVAAIITVILLIIVVVLFILIGLSSDGDLFSNGLFGKDSGRVESSKDDEEDEAEDAESEDDEEEEEEDAEEGEAEAAVEEVNIETTLADIQSKVSAGEYQEALALIGDAKIAHADNEDLYLYEADVYLKQKNHVSAVEALDEGIAATSSEKLANRKQYVTRNTVLVEATPQNGGAGFFHEYNTNGNLIREEIYNSAYEPGGYNEYTYDTTGAISVCNTYNSNGKLEKRSEYRYDSAGALEMVVDYNSKHVRQGWHEYVYDSMGRQIEVIDHINEKKIGWKTVTEYDSYGRLFRNTGYDGRNKVTGWVETKYDGNDNVIMMIRYDAKGKTVEWNETKYDQNGNPSEFINYAKNDTVVNRTKYEYDADGKKTREVYYDGNGIEIGYAEFDIAGKKKTEQNKETGVVWDYKYQYIGDVLSDTGITPVSGTLSFYASVGYKRIPAPGAAYVGHVSKNETYQVIGENADFYQVAEGWYFSKKDSGMNFTQR